MKVLIGCEFSGVVREAFKSRGHDAWSIDLLPTEQDGNHIQGDVLNVLSDGWDLLIAHPPCTYLANSGVRWLYVTGESPKRNSERWTKMEEASKFFKALLKAPINKIAIENPIMHRYAKEIIGRGHDQIIQPWQFGHGETKGTGLWLVNLPLLVSTQIVEGRRPRVHYESPSPDRWKSRSRTLQGIADAMAIQWGKEKW